VTFCFLLALYKSPLCMYVCMYVCIILAFGGRKLPSRVEGLDDQGNGKNTLSVSYVNVRLSFSQFFTCLCLLCPRLLYQKFLCLQWKQCVYMLRVMMGCVDGVWKTKSKEKVSVGASSVSCLLAVNRELWVACESSIHVVSVKASSSSNKLVVNKVCYLLFW